MRTRSCVVFQSMLLATAVLFSSVALLRAEDEEGGRKRFPAGGVRGAKATPDIVQEIGGESVFNALNAPSRTSVFEQSVDPSFDRYVDLNSLNAAITGGKAALLTDIALQLAEGERILMRSHKSGVTSRVILDKAVTLANSKQDQATLQRLSQIAEKRSDKELGDKIATLSKIGSSSRAPSPALTVSLDGGDLTTAVNLKALLDLVKEAELLKDRTLLDEIESRLKQMKVVTESQRNVVDKIIANVRKSVPDTLPPDEEALRKLTASSRGIDLGNGYEFNPGRFFQSHQTGSYISDPPNPEIGFRIRNATNTHLQYFVNGGSHLIPPGASHYFRTGTNQNDAQTCHVRIPTGQSNWNAHLRWGNWRFVGSNDGWRIMSD